MYASFRMRPSSIDCEVGIFANIVSVHRGHQEIAGSTGSVTREYPARSVRTVSGRRKPKNQNARVGVAEPGNRFRPVGVLPKRRAASFDAISPQ